jgi:hypothetical protein
LNPKPHEAQLENQNPMKSSRRTSRRKNVVRPIKSTKSDKTSQNSKEDPRKAQNENRTSKKSSNLKTPPNTLNASSPP